MQNCCFLQHVTPDPCYPLARVNVAIKLFLSWTGRDVIKAILYPCWGNDIKNRGRNQGERSGKQCAAKHTSGFALNAFLPGVCNDVLWSRCPTEFCLWHQVGECQESCCCHAEHLVLRRWTSDGEIKPQASRSRHRTPTRNEMRRIKHMKEDLMLSDVKRVSGITQTFGCITIRIKAKHLTSICLLDTSTPWQQVDTEIRINHVLPCANSKIVGYFPTTAPHPVV